MRKLTAIFAHPDDEGAIAGTLALYASQGVEVSLICATRGEAGEISDPALATSENLGDVREEELRKACAVIGIRTLHFLDYRDSGMADTPANQDPRSLVQADPAEATGRIVALLRQLQPDVVITFEPFGWYGHPDHMAVSKLATAAYEQCGRAAAYPELGQPWSSNRLYHAVLPVSKFKIMTEYAQANGLAEGDGFDPQPIQLEIEKQISHSLNVAHLLEIKQAVIRAHRTQFGEDNWFRKLPDEITRDVWGTEYFIQVFPTLDSTPTQPIQTGL